MKEKKKRREEKIAQSKLCNCPPVSRTSLLQTRHAPSSRADDSSCMHAGETKIEFGRRRQSSFPQTAPAEGKPKIVRRNPNYLRFVARIPVQRSALSSGWDLSIEAKLH